MDHSLDDLFEAMISTDYPDPSEFYPKFVPYFHDGELKIQLRVVEAMSYMMKMVINEANRLVDKEMENLLYSSTNLAHDLENLELEFKRLTGWITTNLANQSQQVLLQSFALFVMSHLEDIPPALSTFQQLLHDTNSQMMETNEYYYQIWGSIQ